MKGYFRKAEVLKNTFQYEDALINYGRALKLDPHNSTILSNFKNSAQMCNRELHLEKNVPWVGSGKFHPFFFDEMLIYVIKYDIKTGTATI